MLLKTIGTNRKIGTIVANLLSEIAYNKLGITKLIYTAKDENIQSQKLLEKIGATLISIYDGYHFYSIDLKEKINEERRMR